MARRKIARRKNREEGRGTKRFDSNTLSLIPRLYRLYSFVISLPLCKIGKIQEFEKDNARRRVPEENSLEGPYTRSTYKLRPITGSAAHRLAPKIKIRGREQSMARIFFFSRSRIEYIASGFVEKGGKPRILLEMEKYRWSIAADFTYDWIAISPRHNTLFARYRSVPSIVYERGRSSVDTNNRALADRRRTTDCFRRHDCCHEPIKCYENTAG